MRDFYPFHRFLHSQQNFSCPEYIEGCLGFNIGANFNVKAYALCVYLELNKALKGLGEEKKSGM